MTEGTSFSWSDLYTRAKSVSFDPIPIGPYHVVVHAAEAKASSNGKPMLKLTLTVQEGPHQNRKLLDQWVVSTDNETALAFFFSRCKTFGFDEAFFASCPPGQLSPLAQAIVGKHAIATVEMREWQGQQRNGIKSYAPYGTGTQSVMPNAGGMPGMMGGMPNVSGGMLGMPNVSGMPGMVPSAPVPMSGAPVAQPQAAPAQPQALLTPVGQQAPQQAPQQAYVPVEQPQQPSPASLLAPPATQPQQPSTPDVQSMLSAPAVPQYQANIPM